MSKPVVYVRNLGLIAYQEAWDLQESLLKVAVDRKIENRKQNTAVLPTHHLLFCEHPHVYTLGKSGAAENLLLDQAHLDQIQAQFFKINRGGDITYHGPGQLVMYPILDLEQFFTDIHQYLRFLEEAVIQTLAHFGISATRLEGLTGVWLDPAGQNARKICAMGVKCSRWVTMHGIALNVDPDLSYFGNIVPCGIQDKAVTSMTKELGRQIDINEVRSVLSAQMATIFNYQIAQS
ncbi:MAG: lipoyl(octanoyl) transferase LipB [Flavobacteriia bacterium]|jgi:lipoyl(octanoyl) transferase|nr:MAG: lipoyl(octanoyl) transferase LipB [Flavobacteriia bacterium]